jgi:hypothetical protein
MLNTKKLITAINSIDDPKRLEIITITDKSIDDQYLYDDELADYNSMLANDHGDFSSINIEDQ